MGKIDMLMPQMGESIAEGTIIKWLKKEGESVEKDEIVLEISTDKVDSEIPSAESGVIAKLLASEGETVMVGSVIAQIQTEGGAENSAPSASRGEELSSADNVAELPVAVASAVAASSAESASGTISTAEKTRKNFSSPLVRSIARAEGISVEELERIAGTGANGRVTKKDIIAYIERDRKDISISGVPSVAYAAPTLPLQSDNRTEVIPMNNMRKSIADHMVKSVQISPHVSTVSEADMTNLVKYRSANKDGFLEQTGVKLTYMPFIVQACVRALLDFPLVNSSVDGDKIIRKKYIGIGVAVALEDNGLIVPVIHNADSLNVVGFARSVHDLASRARSKKLKPEDVQDGTFSITNMGSFGSIMGFGIINQPQVAILGVGVIQKRAVVINDAIAIRDMMYVTLSFDHRIVDGALAGQFLDRIAHYLTNFDTSTIL